MESQTRTLNVKTVAGEVRAFSLPTDAKILQLKEEIAKVFNVQPERQRLIFQGKLLKDELPISEYLKEDNLTIHLMVRAVENPPAPPRPDPANFLQQMMGNLGAMMNPGGGAQFQMFPPFPPQRQPPQQAPVPNRSQSNPRPATEQRPGEAPQSSSQQPRPNQPRQFSLPFNRVHNIGNIVNQMQGPNSGFPPPAMPQLNVERNPLVILGGFLHNYYFQLLRFLPYISRLADLCQRESLINDPQERTRLEALARSVGAGLHELSRATTPVDSLLINLAIGAQPGQFQMRLNNSGVVSSSQMPPNSTGNAPTNIPGSVPPNMSGNVPPSMPGNAPPNMPGNVPPNMPGNAPPNMSGNVPPNMPGNVPPNMPGGVPPNMIGNMIGSMLQNMNPQGSPNPMANLLPQMLQGMGQGGNMNPNMTLRQLMSAMQIEDEEMNLPMMEFFYDLSISDAIGVAMGNWASLDRMRPNIRASLLEEMGEDTPESRSRILEPLVSYLTRTYDAPEQFRNQLQPGADLGPEIEELVKRWGNRALDLVLNFEGENFPEIWKRELQLLVGNYTEILCRNIEGGENAALQMVVEILRNSAAEYMPQEMINMMLGLSANFININLRNCRRIYLEHVAVQQAEANANRSGAILARWEETIASDQAAQSQMRPQRPLSYAYRTSGYHAQPVEEPDLQQLLFDALRPGFTENAVEASGDIPDAVGRSFTRDVIEYIRTRINNDSDFRPGRHQFLDRFR